MTNWRLCAETHRRAPRVNNGAQRAVWRISWAHKGSRDCFINKVFSGQKNLPEKRVRETCCFYVTQTQTRASLASTTSRTGLVCVCNLEQKMLLGSALLLFHCDALIKMEEASARILDNYYCGAIMEFGWDVIMSLPSRWLWPRGSSQTYIHERRKLLHLGTGLSGLRAALLCGQNQNTHAE